MRNSREIEALGAISHGTTAAGYGAILLGAGAVIAGNLIGRPYNRARGNGFEYGVHTAGLTIVATAAAAALVGVALHAYASVTHARDARRDDA
jgi:hypothetical protein